MVEQIDQTVIHRFLRRRLRVEFVGRRLVDVETTSAACDMVAAVLERMCDQVHYVA